MEKFHQAFLQNDIPSMEKHYTPSQRNRFDTGVSHD